MTGKEPNGTTTGTSREQDQGLIRALGNLFREHPAIAGSLLYLQVTTVGVIYSWALFRPFDINIFEYAELNDFFLAAFRNLFLFVVTMVTLLRFVFSLLLVTLASELTKPDRERLRQLQIDASDATLEAHLRRRRTHGRAIAVTTVILLSYTFLYLMPLQIV